MSTVKGNEKKGKLSQILRKFFRREYGNLNLFEVMWVECVDLRGGKDCSAGIRISWNRGVETPSESKTDKKNRLFIARKFISETTWGMNYTKAKNKYGERAFRVNTKITTTPAVVQINVRRATGKRGGWFINVHEQVPFFKEDRFVFRCKWINYWASDAMIVAGLASKFQGGKLGKAIYLNEVLGNPDRVQMVIDMANDHQLLCGQPILPSHADRMEKKMTEQEMKNDFFREWKKNILVTV